MKPLTPNQLALLRRVPFYGTVTAGQCRGAGYAHAIGACNGLMGLVRAGLVASSFSPGSTGRVFQLTEAGQKALAPQIGA